MKATSRSPANLHLRFDALNLNMAGEGLQKRALRRKAAARPATVAVGTGRLISLLEMGTPPMTPSLRRNRRLVWGAGLVAGLVLLGVAVFVPGLRSKLAGLSRSAPDSSYEWISRVMAQCEEEAVTRPETLNFLIVPLSPTRRYGPLWAEKKLAQAGTTLLFGSQDALEGLRTGVFRISSRPVVLHTRDTSNDTTHRWNSVSGVSRLTAGDIRSDGPFEIRFQTSPDDPAPGWSTITAEGRGTCHWAFALVGE